MVLVDSEVLKVFLVDFGALRDSNSFWSVKERLIVASVLFWGGFT